MIASGETWEAFARAVPPVGYQSLVGMVRMGHLRIEGDMLAFGQHLLFLEQLFAGLRPDRPPEKAEAVGAPKIEPVVGRYNLRVAVTTEARRPEVPGVPTFKELGYDLVASTWFTLTGPKGLPKEIAQRLNEEVSRILSRPEIQQRLAQDAFEPKPLTPDQLSAFMASELARWTPVAQAAATK